MTDSTWPWLLDSTVGNLQWLLTTISNELVDTSDSQSSSVTTPSKHPSTDGLESASSGSDESEDDIDEEVDAADANDIAETSIADQAERAKVVGDLPKGVLWAKSKQSFIVKTFVHKSSFTSKLPKLFRVSSSRRSPQKIELKDMRLSLIHI